MERNYFTSFLPHFTLCFPSFPLPPGRLVGAARVDGVRARHDPRVDAVDRRRGRLRREGGEREARLDRPPRERRRAVVVVGLLGRGRRIDLVRGRRRRRVVRLAPLALPPLPPLERALEHDSLRPRERGGREGRASEAQGRGREEEVGGRKEERGKKK